MNDIMHTPGPWEPLRQGIEVQSESQNHEVHANVGGIPVPICEVYQGIHVEHDNPVGVYVMQPAEGLANLRRIVACVNACEGVPTIDLEQAQTPQRETLTGFGLACQQRDELLYVLGRILAAHRSSNNGEVMGEASLCEYFAKLAEVAITNAGGSL